MIAFSKEPILAFDTGELIQLPNGAVAVRWPAGSNTVLSVQPDGRYETRPDTAIGAWESASREGNVLVFRPEGKVYVVPVLEL